MSLTRRWMAALPVALLIALLTALLAACVQAPPDGGLDARVQRVLDASPVQGLALAVVDDGRVVHARSFGHRNAAGAPLRNDTVMHGASLTKAVFAHAVLQLVDEGRLDLDMPIDRMLPGAAIDGVAPAWSAARRDPRWQRLTPRLLLSNRSGFANFAFLEPDGQLRFHFEPGARYAYSGEGLQVLQLALEHGLGVDVGAEIDRRVFQRFGMSRSGMRWADAWADALADNVADGWDAQGRVRPHSRRVRTRVAGSMDTTLDDFARFAAAFARGDGLSPQLWQQMTSAQAPITTARQFPTLQAELPPARRRADLAAGLGVVVFHGPQGAAFFKGGHDDTTANTWVCVKQGRRCVVILSNDVRAERLFPTLVALALGETGAPWDWEYVSTGN